MPFLAPKPAPTAQRPVQRAAPRTAQRTAKRTAPAPANSTGRTHITMRRTVAAAVLAAFVGVGGWSVAGLATAGGGADYPALPWPAVGDVGAYDAVFRGDETVEFTLTFEWQEPDHFKDGRGTWHEVYPVALRMETEDADGNPLVFSQSAFLRRDDLEPIAGSIAAMSGSSSSTSPGTAYSSETHVQMLEFGAVGLPCGFVNSLQGDRQHAPVGVLGCPEDEATFAGTSEWEGLRTYAFSVGDRHRVEYAAGIAYPVRHQASTPHGTFEMVLRAFEPGPAKTPTWPPAPAATPMPKAKMGAVGPLGPDDSGVEHPYPIRTAVDQAMSDVTFADLRTYLDNNPDARLVAASYVESETGQGRIRAWHLEYSATAGSLSMAYGHHEHLVVGDLAGTPLEPFVRRQDTVSYAHTYDRPLVDPASIPETLPTVASAVAAWATYVERPASEGTHWGFRLRVCESCEPIVWAGDANDAHWAAASLGIQLVPRDETSVREPSRLVLDAEGQPLEVWLAVETTSRSSGVPVAQSGAAPERPPPLAASLWIPPSPTVAAGWTGAALLVAAGYWLWPLAKAAPMTLFSRVLGPGVAHHPARRAILSAIDVHPGIHFQALARATRLPNGTLVHHLRKLEESGLVTAARNAGRTCYLRAGVDHRVASAAPALAAAGARRVFEAALRSPGLTARDVAAATGLSPATVSHHLGRLRGAGLVTSHRMGSGIAIEPTATGRAAAAVLDG